MSSDDEPIISLNSPGSTAKLLLAVWYQASSEAGRVKVTCFVSPGASVTRSKARRLWIGCTAIDLT